MNQVGWEAGDPRDCRRKFRAEFSHHDSGMMRATTTSNAGKKIVEPSAYIGCFQTYIISMLHGPFHLFFPLQERRSEQ